MAASPGSAATVDHLHVDAVFAEYDQLAVASIRRLHAAGRGVPADVAVPDFDDEPAARMAARQLTTVRQPCRELGRRAVELLIRQIEHDAAPIERQRLDPVLVVRDSA